MVVFITHFLSETVTITDSRWTLHTSLSILRNHDTNLDEYESSIVAQQFYAIDKVDEHYYYSFPIGTPLLILPVVKAIDFAAHHVLYYDIHSPVEGGYSGGIQLFIASLIVAITSVFVYLFCFLITSSKWQSVFLVFVFAYCTSVWSTASRALWGHTSSILMLSIALYALLRAREMDRWLVVAGFAVAYAYVVRPTNSLAVIFFSAYVLFSYPRRMYVYVAGVVLVFVPFILYNYHIYHHLLSPYYNPNLLKVGRSLKLEAFAGILFSPARGLFIFSPVLIFSIAGVLLLFVRRKFTLLDGAILLILLSHYYVIASITTPYAGFSFGPRYFCDMMPFFIYFLIYFIQYLMQMQRRPMKYALSFFLLVTLSASFFINYRGATRPSTFMWNEVPNTIDQHLERIWDWNDLQFMR